MLPDDLPQWETPYVCFTSWSEDGTWEKIEEALRQRVRRAAGKRPAPTAGIIDSQAVKTSDQGGPHGFDVAKQTAGRKRHILVDTLGLIWLVRVTAANVQDRDGALLLLAKLGQRGLGRMRLIWADSAYNARKIWHWIGAHLPRRGLRLEVCDKSEGETCHVERWNCTLRQRLGRFVRKTLSFSKCDRMHELALRLFIHQYNQEPVI